MTLTMTISRPAFAVRTARPTQARIATRTAARRSLIVRADKDPQQAAKDAGKSVNEGLEGALNKAKGAVDDLKGEAKDKSGDAKSEAKSAASKAESEGKGLGDKIKDNVSDAADKVKENLS